MIHVKIQGRRITIVGATGTEKIDAMTTVSVTVAVTVTVTEVDQIHSNAEAITCRCAPQKRMKKSRSQELDRMTSRFVVVGLDKDQTIVVEAE